LTPNNIAKLELALRSYIENSKEIIILISCFTDNKYGILENLVYYLKTELKLTNSEIASLLNRDSRTIWSVINKTKDKKNSLKTKQINIYVPLNIFQNRHFSPLEALTHYMNKELHYSVKSIAEILNKPYQSIWITLRNAKKK